MSYDLKICKICGISKNVDNFPISKQILNKIYYRKQCKPCHMEINKKSRLKHYKKNKNIILEDKRKYYEDNKNIILNKVKIYNSTHKIQKNEYNMSYYKDNKKIMQIRSNIYRKEKRKTDPIYKLRADFSTIIRRALKNNGGSKKKSSIKKYLPYSIKELKLYLENQFEPWMTWENNSNYNTKIWNDNDQSTWTWQLDHIIPQSDLPYYSMEDDNFKKCWALNNLRPLNSKQNWMDGINRSRHGVANVI
jgi:hypothetical protein